MNLKSSLREKQSAFVRMLPRLIEHATSLGYELTVGDAYRDPRVHGPQGVKGSYSAGKSAHKSRLAIDLNLFKNGRYLPDTAAHRPLGEFWESIGGVWGGRWNDGNHYEYGASK